MNIIHSKDMYYVIRDVLKCLDPKVMNHGSRTAYILGKMLQCDNKLEMYEVAEFAYITAMHDIGAYKTDKGVDQLQYETREFMPHSIFGYLFFLYLSPFKDRAKVILYHHTDYNMIPKDYEYAEIAAAINVAEKMDIYSNLLGSKFDYQMFQKHADTKYSPKALDLLYQAEKKYQIFSKLQSGEYKSELSELFEYLIFSDEEKEAIVRGVMYCVGMRSEYTLFDMVTCTHICSELGLKMNFSKDEMTKLHYAAALHDAGMCAVPKEIIEAPRRLSDEEMGILRKHVSTVDEILRGRVDNDVYDIVLAHHERGDGSGYPKKLRDANMNRSQKILQVADTVTGLTAPRSFREPKAKAVVIEILKEEATKGRLCKEVVRTMIAHYDEIMDGVKVKSAESLSMYIKLNENYKIMEKQFKK